jgi:hypothetical protein
MALDLVRFHFVSVLASKGGGERERMREGERMACKKDEQSCVLGWPKVGRGKFSTY